MWYGEIYDTSLVHLEILARVIEALIKWEQPTPAQYVRVAPVPVMEILYDSEEEPEEDPEEQSAEEIAPVSSSEASGSDGLSEGGQQNWLLESGSESSHQFHLEWMVDRYSQCRVDRTDPPLSF